MTVYEQLRRAPLETPKTWLVTGVAGFIGSNLLETLLPGRLDRDLILGVGSGCRPARFLRDLGEIDSPKAR